MSRSLSEAWVEAVSLVEAQRRLWTEEPVGFSRLDASESLRCSWSEL